MALMITRVLSESFLEHKANSEGNIIVNHIFEPEFHQEKYVSACKDTQAIQGAFQLGDSNLLVQPIRRGTQPLYADDDDDPSSLIYEGMILKDGSVAHDVPNVCVIKSNCIRNGFVDTSLARSTTNAFYKKKKDVAGIQKNDILINSTGDGTIGRVAVYNYDFPAIADGHVTIVRYKNVELAWYVAAFLLTEIGQNQIYRFINGSSGQVEIYPQDIERIWIKPADNAAVHMVYTKYYMACKKHDEFYTDLKAALYSV